MSLTGWVSMGYVSKVTKKQGGWITLIGVVTAVLIFVVAELIGIDTISSWLLIILLISLAYAFVDKKDLFSSQNLMPFWGFIVAVRTLIIINIEPITWFGLDNFPLQNPILTLNLSLAVTILTLISYEAGFRVNGGQKKFAKLLPKPTIVIKGKQLTFTIYILFAVGLIAQIYMINQLGGLGNILRNLGVVKDTTGLGILMLISNLMMNVVLILYFRGASQRNFIIKLFLGAGLSAVLFMMGRRANVLPLIVFAVFAYFYKYKKFKFRTALLLGVIGYALVAIMVLLRIYVQHEFYRSIILENPLRFYFINSGGDMIVVDAMYNIIGRENGFEIRTWSLYHWYGIFPYLLPRFLFPWKPTYEAIPRLINTLYINPDVVNGIPANIIGTLYLNAGYFGAIVGSFIFGYISKTAKNYRTIYKNNNIALIVYTVVVYTMLQFIRSGDFTGVMTIILTQFGALMFIIVVLYMIKFLIDFKRFRQEPALQKN